MAERYGSSLRRGKSQSCVTCANRRLARERSTATLLVIPQAHYSRLANRFYAARARCNNSLDPAYPSYGGRGIQCRFATTADYISYLITLPGWDDPAAEVDRKDNDGHYEEGNLRFTSRGGNTNTRVNRRIEYRGATYTAVQFWREFAPKYRDKGTVARKIRAGFSPEQIILDQAGCKGPYLRHTQRRATV